jgi:hypothetical protein
MNRDLAELTAALAKNAPASESLVRTIEDQIGIAFPADYREFIRRSNGGEGVLGPGSYLQLWPIEEIPKLNAIARVTEFAPGLVLFGSDGGSMSYAFDTRQLDNIQFVQVPDIPLSLDEVEVLGHTFVEFLEYLYRQP